MEFGLLVERGAEHRGTAGRPGLVVDVARDGVVALGLEVNVDYVGVQATDLAGGSRYKGMEAADNRGRAVEDVLDRLGELTRGALERGAGAGAAADRRHRRAAGAGRHRARLAADRAEPALAGRARSSSCCASGSRRRRCRSAIDNEANLAALAELWEGAATGISDFVYASGEIGVGGGIVLGGELYRGYRGFGGEFGHTTVEHDGLPVRVRLARLPGDARGARAAARRRGPERRRGPLARARASRSAELVRRAQRGRADRARARWRTAGAGSASRSGPSSTC